MASHSTSGPKFGLPAGNRTPVSTLRKLRVSTTPQEDKECPLRGFNPRCPIDKIGSSIGRKGHICHHYSVVVSIHAFCLPARYLQVDRMRLLLLSSLFSCQRPSGIPWNQRTQLHPDYSLFSIRTTKNPEPFWVRGSFRRFFILCRFEPRARNIIPFLRFWLNRNEWLGWGLDQAKHCLLCFLLRKTHCLPSRFIIPYIRRMSSPVPSFFSKFSSFDKF